MSLEDYKKYLVDSSSSFKGKDPLDAVLEGVTIWKTASGSLKVLRSARKSNTRVTFYVGTFSYEVLEGYLNSLLPNHQKSLLEYAKKVYPSLSIESFEDIDTLIKTAAMWELVENWAGYDPGLNWQYVESEDRGHLLSSLIYYVIHNELPTGASGELPEDDEESSPEEDFDEEFEFSSREQGILQNYGYLMVFGDSSTSRPMRSFLSSKGYIKNLDKFKSSNEDKFPENQQVFKDFILADPDKMHFFQRGRKLIAQSDPLLKVKVGDNIYTLFMVLTTSKTDKYYSPGN